MRRLVRHRQTKGARMLPLPRGRWRAVEPGQRVADRHREAVGTIMARLYIKTALDLSATRMPTWPSSHRAVARLPIAVAVPSKPPSTKSSSSTWRPTSRSQGKRNRGRTTIRPLGSSRSGLQPNLEKKDSEPDSSAIPGSAYHSFGVGSPRSANDRCWPYAAAGGWGRQWPVLAG